MRKRNCRTEQGRSERTVRGRAVNAEKEENLRIRKKLSYIYQYIFIKRKKEYE